MTKRTRSEYERDGLPLGAEGIHIVATSEAEASTAQELPREEKGSVGLPGSVVPGRASVAEVESDEESAQKLAKANEEILKGLGDCPFWALLSRAGYEMW